jgi:ribosomal protein S18 acetylase RimI-like enzyme
LEEEKSKGPKRFLETLSASPSDKIAIGAFVEENLAGIATLIRGVRTKDKHAVNLFGMFVGVAYRGHGIGGGILDFALKHAVDEMQAKMMFLSVEANNQGAIKLYESRGFKAWGTQPKSAIDLGVYYDEIHMAKEIS